METVYLNEAGIYISSSRMAFHGRTFSPADVNGVVRGDGPVDLRGAMILLVLGIITLMTSLLTLLGERIGLGLAGLGLATVFGTGSLLWLRAGRPMYDVHLSLDSGDQIPVATGIDGSLADRVVEAVQEALAADQLRRLKARAGSPQHMR